MNELEKAYFDKWKEEVNKNRKLTQQLENIRKKKII